MKRYVVSPLFVVWVVISILGCQKGSDGSPTSAEQNTTSVVQQQTQQTASELPPAHPPASGSESPQLPPGTQNPMEEIMKLKARLDKNPKDLEALISLGNANMMISRVEVAQDLYRRALEINPKNLDVRTNLAIAYRSSGKLDEAIGELKKNLEVDSENDATLYNLGFIYYYDKKDPIAALALWKKWLDLYPNAPASSDVAQQIAKIESEVQKSKAPK